MSIDAQGVRTDHRTSWREDGFAILPAFYGDFELDQATAAVEQEWRDRASPVVVDDLVTHRRQRLKDVDATSRKRHRFKVNDLYLRHESIRRLALNERITPILRELLGDTPVVCNSLNFEQGSEQPDHVDSLYMTPRTPQQLVAIWVALEDCDPQAGPLRYYPGSHRIAPYVFADGGHHAVEAEMPLWHAYIASEAARLGLEPRTFAARRGDVFIWSANLLHGGAPITREGLTRRSAVFHYFTETDCRALRARLVSEGGGYWIRRSHQPVPGTWQARLRLRLARLRSRWSSQNRTDERVS